MKMASPLENFVNSVRTLSSAGQHRELADFLNASTELLSHNHSILDNVLETLDITQHTVAITAVLVAKLTYIMKNNLEAEATLRQVGEFVQTCDWDQARSALGLISDLCHIYSNLVIKSNVSAIPCIKVMCLAVEKLRTTESQLTPIHADLCMLSLRAKYFKPALSILDVDITVIATTDENNHDAKYLLLYYYYGGMIYSALKNYDRAMYFFEAAVSTPALAMSYIMLESYKKYILVSLISEGRLSCIPKYSSQVLTRFIKPLSMPYLQLAKAYENMSSDELRTVAVAHQDTFARDRNTGLVRLVTAALYKKKIQRLTQTFLTLSLEDVAAKVRLSGPDEAEQYILSMVKEGEIFATINKKDGMVLFQDDPEKFTTPATLQLIQDEITHVIEMNKQIIKMDEEIKLNPQFIKKSTHPQEEEMALQPKGFPADPLD